MGFHATDRDVPALKRRAIETTTGNPVLRALAWSWWATAFLWMAVWEPGPECWWWMLAFVCALLARRIEIHDASSRYAHKG